MGRGTEMRGFHSFSFHCIPYLCHSELSFHVHWWSCGDSVCRRNSSSWNSSLYVIRSCHCCCQSVYTESNRELYGGACNVQDPGYGGFSYKLYYDIFKVPAVHYSAHFWLVVETFWFHVAFCWLIFLFIVLIFYWFLVIYWYLVYNVINFDIY